MRYKAAIFDMDGTVLDTAEDLRRAISYAMQEAGYGEAEFSRAQACAFFGSGVRVAIKRALAELGREANDAEVLRIEKIYRPYYAEHCDEATGAFPGICEMLMHLRETGIRTAVVSNKPDAAAKELSEKHFGELMEMTSGEREAEGIRRKPAPDMVFDVCRLLGVKPEEAVYVGDSEVDIETAESAGMPCICVSWGFRDTGALRECGADVICDTADELEKAITG